MISVLNFFASGSKISPATTTLSVLANKIFLPVLAATKVVSNGWLSMGEETKNFEERFGDFLGKDVYCKAVSNGTAALHMALLALDVGDGDEVIIP